MKKMIFLKVKNSYNKKLVTWLDLNLQVALKYIFSLILTIFMIIFLINFSNLGILVNFLSFETLTILSNSVIFYLISHL